MSKDNPVAGHDGPGGGLRSARGMPAGFAVVTIGKWLSNVAFRLVFPFLPRIAAGLGVSLSAMGTALAVRELAGLTNPALGRAADRRGHGRAMVTGLIGLALALLLHGVSTGLVVFTVGLILLSLAKSLFDVAAAAWVGDAVPFQVRGRAIGMLETSWALAFVIGMPIAALLIRAGTWRLPFVVTAGACVAMAAVSASLLPTEQPRRAGVGTAPLRDVWTPVVRAAAATFVCIGVAHSMILVTFSSWLEDTHGVSIGELGLTAFVIGTAELAGSAGTAAFGDRIGLHRGLVVGLVLSGGASLLLLLGDVALWTALVTMAVYFAVVEYTIVVLLSLFSEIAPKARGTAMGIAFAAFAIGHAVGAVLGTQLYERVGMTENLVAMAVALTVAVIPARSVIPVEDA
ncbi:MAG: MFS transporter [Actinomycetota bacterium]